MQAEITVIIETGRTSDLLGLKEAIANYAEQFGDIVKVDVQPVSRQITLKGGPFS